MLKTIRCPIWFNLFAFGISFQLKAMVIQYGCQHNNWKNEFLNMLDITYHYLLHINFYELEKCFLGLQTNYANIRHLIIEINFSSIEIVKLCS